MELLADDPPIPLTLLECAFQQLARDMCRALPPAATAEEHEDRKKAVIAQVGALQPVSTAEFALAGQYALSLLRSQLDLAKADEPGLPAAEVLKWNSHSQNKARQATSTLRSLLRLQAERERIEADPERRARGERLEHHLTTLMAEAVLGPKPVSLPAEAFDGESVSFHDPESHMEKTETHPRHSPPPPPTEESPPPTGSEAGAHSATDDHPVSSHDPESHLKKTETHPRRSPPLPLAGESLPPTGSGGPPQRWRVARPGFDIPYPGGAPDDLYLPPRSAEA